MVLKSSKTRVLVNISLDLKEEAETIAASQNRSLSNYIVTLIQRDVEEQKLLEE